MTFLKRAFFFVAVNIAVMLTVSLIISVFGLDAYIGVGNQGLLLFCLIWGMAGSFISLFLSKFMAKRMMMWGNTINVAINVQSDSILGQKNKVHLLPKFVFPE